MITVDNGTDKPGVIYGSSEGQDLAVILSYPTSFAKDRGLMTKELEAFLKENNIANRLGALLVVHPARPKLKSGNGSIKDLRSGWQRVQRELITFCPNVKRVLLMGDTATYKVAINNEASTEDWHGGIYNLGVSQGKKYVQPAHYELIPTFEFEQWNKLQYRPWIKRDCERLCRLKKQEAPLEYTEGIPEWLLS